MGTPRSFQSRVQHVAKGSPVSAGNIGRTTRELEARDQYLREAVEAIESGRLLLLKDQTVETDALQSQPVYWNAENQQYERCLAGTDTDADSGTLVATAASDCLGLIYTKTAANKADIAMLGMAKFDSLENAIDGAITPGRYYISAVSPGKLVRQRPPATVAACYVLGPLDDCDTSAWVFILPQMRDFLEDHIHYRFELTPLPAGTTSPPDPAGCHEITAADTSAAGWLPADDASFGGHAPTGAKFGYNLAADDALSRVWPPVPLEAAAVFWDKGEGGLLGASEIPSRGANPAVVIDRYGIWWMSCCYGDVPWPKDYDNTASSLSSISSVESSESGSVTCRTDSMRLVLAFMHTVYASDKTVVTSLQPATGEPLEFVNCDGEVAKTGDLFAKFLLTALIDDDEAYGGLVLKSLVGPGLKFGQGYAVEGLISGNENISLNGTRQRYLVPGDNTTDVVHQGLVTLSVLLEPSEKELSPLIVKLGDVLEREYKGVVYLGLPAARDSALRMRFNVPSAGLPASPRMLLRAFVFGRGSDGPLPEIAVGYYRLALPTDGVPTPITEGDTAVTFDVVTPSAGLDADNVIVVESEDFEVAAGDTVMIQMTREAAAEPTYDNDFGVVRAVAVIVTGA